MGTAVLEMPKEVCAPCEIGTLGAFFQPSVTSGTNLRRSDERLIGELVAVLDRQLLAAVDSRTESEFVLVRRRVLPRYVRALRALQDTANLVSDDVPEEISENIIADLAADLQRHESRFGAKLIEQSIFTLWTMQKIRSLAAEICKAGDVSPEHKAADDVLIHEYHGVSLWAQFHLDILFAAMKFDRPICEEIREQICDGLRASVNAYAVMKDALYLRRPQEQDIPASSELPWDDEDAELLASSMRDIDADSSDLG